MLLKYGKVFFSLISLFDASISGFPVEENGKCEWKLKKNPERKKKSFTTKNNPTD